jgi:glycosyltransferase involved in cell wall biosynthesis
MSIDVSVIIPSFNRARLIGETIDSILAQTAAPAEVIVVDDGSTDDTAAVIRGFGARVRYHRVEAKDFRNIGPSAARNLGVSLATSPWIAFCDSDDLWLTTKLERQLRIHALCPAVEYSFTDFSHVVSGTWESRSRFAKAPAGYWEAQRRVLENAIWIYETSLYERAIRFQAVAPSTVLISKRRFDALGGFCERFSRGLSEDVEFALRNLGHPPMGVLAEPQVGIRRHDGNRSADMLNNWLDQMRVLEYALATHAMAASCADALSDEIQKRRVHAAGRAFAAGRLDIVRDLAPAIGRQYRDWKTMIRIAVGTLPAPLAGIAQRILVTANLYLSKLI